MENIQLKFFWLNKNNNKYLCVKKIFEYFFIIFFCYALLNINLL